MRKLSSSRALLAIVASAAAACAATPPLAYAPPGPQPALLAAARPAGSVAAILLNGHNVERAAVGTAPLVWDAELAASAAAHAQILAAAGRLQHSVRSTRPGQSENLWIGTRGAYDPEAMVGSWAAEKALFRPGIFPNVSRTGNWVDVSHYTQMIWRDTTRLGCGIGSSAGFDILVCRYAPSGNRDGRPVP